jgi:endo-1,4-beta-xylanase
MRHSKVSIPLVGVLLLLLGVPLASAQDVAPSALRRRADAHDLLLGSAVSLWRWDPQNWQILLPLHEDVRYRRNLARHFNVVTSEDVLKWDHLRVDPDTYDFEAGDILLDFAERHDQKVHGHTLLWYLALPDWVSERSWTKAEQFDLAKEHIETVVGHYAGRVHTWDVVNEAMDDFSGELRHSMWTPQGSDLIIRRAFRWARRADRKATLCYNDYNHADMEGWQKRKADAVYEMVKGWVEIGVPIHCVGFQFHVDTEHLQTAVAENFRRYAELGLEVQITELDVRIEEPVTQEGLDAQAAVYREVAELCLEAENCTSLILWGFTDRYSWVTFYLDGWASATIMSEDYEKKPAFWALKRALR